MPNPPPRKVVTFVDQGHLVHIFFTAIFMFFSCLLSPPSGKMMLFTASRMHGPVLGPFRPVATQTVDDEETPACMLLCRGKIGPPIAGLIDA